MRGKDLALLGALGVAGYLFVIKPNLSTSQSQDYGSGGGGSLGAAFNPLGELFGLVDNLNPFNIGQNIGKQAVSPLINYLGTSRYETPVSATTNISTPNAVLRSSISGDGSYYGATTYTSSGAAVVQTARSAQKAAVNYFVPKQSITTQAKVASALGVPVKFINPNVNRSVQSSKAKNSSALFKYLK